MDRNGETAHAPVMLEEMVEALAVDRDGFYVDATFGRGGHARGLLAQLSPRGRLLAIDRDADAYDSARRLAKADARVQARHGRFGSLKNYLEGDGQGGPGAAQSGVMLWACLRRSLTKPDGVSAIRCRDLSICGWTKTTH